MLKCNNPKCGFESPADGRPTICRKCGFIMESYNKPNKKTRKAIEEIEKGEVKVFETVNEFMEDIDGD